MSTSREVQSETKSERFIELCNLAMCSPDFAVIHNLGSSDARKAKWLFARLHKKGIKIDLPEIIAAVKAWDTRVRGVEHTIVIIH